MENAILAGQQKRQRLLLHLGGHDIANLLSPLQDVVRDAAGADLAECGGGGVDHDGAPWEEAETGAQSEWGEVGAGSSGEEGAGEERRRHGHGHERAADGRSLRSFCPPAGG